VQLLVFLQIVLTVSQTMWCRDITECLISEGDRLQAMKGAEQICVQVIDLLCIGVSIIILIIIIVTIVVVVIIITLLTCLVI